MMRNKVGSISLLCIFFTSLFSISYGQVEDPCGQPWSTPLSEVEGEIVSIYYATPPFTNQQGLHLELSETSSQESFIIHVFPKTCVDNDPDKFNFTVGEVVTVTGSEFSTPVTERNICAAQITEYPDLQLRTLDTGCMNMELCVNCEAMCDVQCANATKPDICMNNCLENCQSQIIPCEAGVSPVHLTPIYPLLLIK